MKKVLVTGCAGFIGSHVAERLLQRGDTVIGIDNANDHYPHKQKVNNLLGLGRHRNFKFYKRNISDFESIRHVFEKNRLDYIAHLAERAGVQASVSNPFIYANENIIGTMVMLEHAKEYKVKNFVICSSSSVYGNRNFVPFNECDMTERPVSPYAATKKSVEVIAHVYHHLYGLNINIVRAFMVYGPRGNPNMVPCKFMLKMLKGEEIWKSGEGDSKRDCIYIDDFVEGFVSAIDRPFGYEIFNLGSGSTVTLNKLISTIEAVTGKSAKIREVEHHKADVSITHADITKAFEKLDYMPTTNLSTGLSKLYEWVSSQGAAGIKISRSVS